MFRLKNRLLNEWLIVLIFLPGVLGGVLRVFVGGPAGRRMLFLGLMGTLLLMAVFGGILTAIGLRAMRARQWPVADPTRVLLRPRAPLSGSRASMVGVAYIAFGGALAASAVYISVILAMLYLGLDWPRLR